MNPRASNASAAVPSAPPSRDLVLELHNATLALNGFAELLGGYNNEIPLNPTTLYFLLELIRRDFFEVLQGFYKDPAWAALGRHVP